MYIGSQQREVNAIDSSTIARWRTKAGMDLLGKGYYHKCQDQRLLVVDAGIATQEQFAAATEQDALLGRLPSRD